MNDQQKAFVSQILQDYQNKERILTNEKELAQEQLKKVQQEKYLLQQELNLQKRSGRQIAMRFKVDATKLIFYTGYRTKAFRNVADTSSEQNLIIQVTFQNNIEKPFAKPFTIDATYYFACSIYGNKKLKENELYSNHVAAPDIRQLKNYIWVNLTPHVCTELNLKLIQELNIKKVVTGDKEDYLELVFTEL
jgi:hypothetical protein